MPRLIALQCLIAVALCLIFCAAPCAAKGIEDDQTRPDSPQRSRSSFVVLPYAYYSPETKIAFGAGSIYSFRSAEAPADARPSSVRVALTYTQLSQMILALTPEMYLQEERYYYSGFYGYYRYPDAFWGIGGDTPDGAEERYRANDFESSTIIQRRILAGIYAGALFQYRGMNVDDTVPRGVLRTGAIPGSRGGSASGFGIIVRHDTRDHVYQPSTGFYNQCSAVFFGRALGSDYTFNVLSIDLRMYRAVFGSHVLAFQSYNSFISGDAPFQMLSRLGGSYWMRGYYLGRYRDNDMITAQIEYRFPLLWRLGAVGFAGVGDVGSDIREFRIDRFKYSLGCGVRFMFDPRERINARLDIGIGGGDNAGVYAMVLEAF